MYVWIIACMDAHIASELDFGQIAHTGLQKCAISLTAFNGNHIATAQRGYKKSDPKTGDQVFTRDELHPLPTYLCEELFSVCCTIPEYLINDTVKTAQGGGI